MMKKIDKKIVALLLGGALASSTISANVFEALPLPPQLEENAPTPDNGYGVREVETWVNNYGDSAFTLSGVITLPSGVVLGDSNSVSVILLNASTLDEIASAIVDANGEYKIYFPDTTSGTKSYILKVVSNIDGEIKEYYIDFGTDNYISGVSTASSDGFMSSEDISWSYDSVGNRYPKDLNTLAITADNGDNVLDLDLTNTDCNKYTITGKVKVASDFVNGDITVEAIDKDNGKRYYAYSSTKTGDYYDFELKVLNTTSNIVIKVSTNNADTYEYKEMYYNLGDDHKQTSDDIVISTKNIEYKVTYQGSGVYVPDTTKTSYLSISGDTTLSSAIDTTTFGQNDYKISGIVTPKSDFDYTKTTIKIDLISATDGSVLTQGYANCSESTKTCAYELELGSILNDVDSNGNGGYALKLTQKVIWQTPLELFYDFGTDYSVNSNETFVLASDVVYKNNTIPDVNYYLVNQDTKENKIDINLNNYTPLPTYKVKGKLVDIPENAKYVNVTAYNPKKGIFSYFDITKALDGYIYNLENLTEGNYVINASYTAIDTYGTKQHYEFVLSDDDSNYNDNVTAIYKNDITYSAYDVNGAELNTMADGFDYSTVSYYAPASSSMKSLNLDQNMSVPNVSVKPIEYTDYNLTLNSLDDVIGKNMTITLSRGGYYDTKAVSATVTDTTQSFVFEKMRASDDYQLSVDVEGNKRLYYDIDNNKLSEDVYYLGYQDNSVCNDYRNSIYTCKKNEEIEWKLNLSTTMNVSNDYSKKTIPFPTKNSISVDLDLGSSYANQDIVLYLSQFGGHEFVWENISLDENGQMSKSLNLSPNNNYKISLRIGYDWYVISAVDGGGYELISENNAYSTVGQYKPLDSTMLDISSSDLAISSLSLPQVYAVTVNFENLNKTNSVIDEAVLVSLISNRWYSGNNINKSTGVLQDSTTINLIAGDYKINLHSSIGKSGMVDNDGDNATDDSDKITNSVDFTTDALLTWDKAKADTITISGDTTITVKLKSLDSYKHIAGSVTLGDGDIEKGWICATKGNDGRCSEVATDGTFKIKSLSPSGDYSYLVEYWADSGENIRQMVTMSNGESVEDATIELATQNKLTISGNLQNSTNEVKEISILEVASDNSWKIVKSKAVNLATDYDYSFADIAPAMSGYHYEIVVAIPTIDKTTGEATYTLNNATKLDGSSGVASGINTNNDVVLTTN
jgi:hypothetical protein